MLNNTLLVMQQPMQQTWQPTHDINPNNNVSPPDRYYEATYNLFPEPPHHHDVHSFHRAEEPRIQADAPEAPKIERYTRRHYAHESPKVELHVRRHLEDIERWKTFKSQLAARRSAGKKVTGSDLKKLKSLVDIAKGRKARHWWWKRHQW